MNTTPDLPATPESDLAAAQERIRELEQELEAASDIIDEQEISIECFRVQLEEAGFTIDEGTAARRRLEERIADLEDEPCPVTPPKQGSSQSPVALKFEPVPPAILKATPTDLAELEALVGKLGWEELMFRLGVLITRQAQETTGPHKGALEAAAGLVNLWGPSFYWCNEEVCRKLVEQERLRMSRRQTS